MKKIELITPIPVKNTKNMHIEKNLEMFSQFNVQNKYMGNWELLTSDLSEYDAIYLNWFENIDGGKFYMPILRYWRRKIQLHRIKKSKLKVIFSKHNRFPHDTRYPRLSKKIYRDICELADVIIAFNNDANADFHEVFPNSDYSNKIRVIPPVNYIGAYKPNPNSPIYARLHEYKNKLIIGFVGKILPYKNVELIIRAAKELKNEEIHFLIAGEPVTKEYGEKLQSEIDGVSNITAIFERVSDDEMYPIMEVCDIFLMPYDTTSASNSGAGRLAFSYAKTVISPDISSMNEIPSKLIFKYHYEDKDEHFDVMMEKINEAYNNWKSNPQVLKSMGDALFKLMETDYSERAIQSKYQDVFEELFRGNDN